MKFRQLYNAITETAGESTNADQKNVPTSANTNSNNDEPTFGKAEDITVYITKTGNIPKKFYLISAVTPGVKYAYTMDINDPTGETPSVGIFKHNAIGLAYIASDIDSADFTTIRLIYTPCPIGGANDSFPNALTLRLTSVEAK